jgi:hypothetical protein
VLEDIPARLTISSIEAVWKPLSTKQPSAATMIRSLWRL